MWPGARKTKGVLEAPRDMVLLGSAVLASLGEYDCTQKCS